jgi:polar amino acid transport system substrate-binding protein
MRKQLVLTLVLAVFALAAAACGADEEVTPTAAGTETAAAPDPCAKDQLNLKTAGQLTIATDNPAFPPWFQDAEGAPWDPTTEPTKQGYEGAVSYAVANEMGFSDDEVKWVVVPFDNVFKPGPKDFDFDINQVSYKPARAEAVDFSDSYYDVNQALVAAGDSAIADATTVADLANAKLGAPIGTTSLDVIQDVIQPSQEPNVYNDQALAIQDLKSGAIDGVIVDLPSAFFITAVQFTKGVVVGQFELASQEYFAMAFETGSPLVECVNLALEEMKADGTLDAIHQEWLADKTNAPVLS